MAANNIYARLDQLITQIDKELDPARRATLKDEFGRLLEEYKQAKPPSAEDL